MNPQPSNTTPRPARLWRNPLYHDPQVKSDVQRGEELADALWQCALQQATPQVRALLKRYVELRILCETLRLEKHDGVCMSWFYARLVKTLCEAGVGR